MGRAYRRYACELHDANRGIVWWLKQSVKWPKRIAALLGQRWQHPPFKLNSSERLALAQALESAPDKLLCLVNYFANSPKHHHPKCLLWLRQQIRVHSLMSTFGGEPVVPQIYRVYLGLSAEVFWGHQVRSMIPDACFTGSLECARALSHQLTDRKSEVIQWLGDNWLGELALNVGAKPAPPQLAHSIDFHRNKQQWYLLEHRINHLSHGMLAWLCRFLGLFSSTIRHKNQLLEESVNKLSQLVQLYLKASTNELS